MTGKVHQPLMPTTIWLSRRIDELVAEINRRLEADQELTPALTSELSMLTIMMREAKKW